MRPDSANPIEILLIEDNLGDIRLIEEVFKDAKIDNKMQVALDGEKAMKMLRREGEYSQASRPDIVLLDLNLPRKDGREVLKEIKEDKSLKCIPVIILTTSTAEEDIIETYKHNANCYITKPFDFDHFIKVISNIEDFWLNIVKLPPR
ncbi:MAG: response regulator [Methanobacterium sp.]|uniref:response regulator n=1 Tax=Methanobacterium sp. TaxID=2164 RepID=UPI003D64BAF3|nr:response regulator [Methanobacterium sp.]